MVGLGDDRLQDEYRTTDRDHQEVRTHLRIDTNNFMYVSQVCRAARTSTGDRSVSADTCTIVE